MMNLAAHYPDSVGGQFRKARTTTWTSLGRFNATPFTASVPLTAGGGPESWEFYAMAVRADVEFGQGSAILPVIVRP